METQNTNMRNFNNENWNEKLNEQEASHRKGKIVGGILVVIIGAAMLAKEMGVFFPEWLFSWQMLLIVIGLFVGIKNSFRNISWIILIGLGSAFMVEEFIPDLHFKIYFWPIIIMAIGLKMILRPRHNRFGKKWDKRFNHRGGANFYAFGNEKSSSSEDNVDMDVVFSGFKKNIISKDFKGGVISCVFGGGEINLSQADINGTVILELKQVFGGIKIIVPGNWEVQIDKMDTIFGGVEDKRANQHEARNPDKILIIKGSAVFGGIDIRSY